MRVCVNACVSACTLVCAYFAFGVCVVVLVLASARIEAAPPSPMHACAQVLIARAASASSHIGTASTVALQLGKMEEGGDAVLLGLAKNPTASARALLRLAEVLASMRLSRMHSSSRAYVHMNACINAWCARPHVYARWYSACVRAHRHAAAAYLHRTKAASPYCSCLGVRTIRRCRAVISLVIQKFAGDCASFAVLLHRHATKGGERGRKGGGNRPRSAAQGSAKQYLASMNSPISGSRFVADPPVY